MKKFLTAIFCPLLCFFSCLFPLVSCKNDDGLKPVRINEVTHSIFYAPLYLADALGYFEEEGLKLDLTNGGGADKVMAAVLSGDADIGFCGPEAALYVLAGGSSDAPVVFGQLTKRDGSFLVSRKQEPTFKWSDLKGKEIIAGRKGGVPAMTLEYVLNDHGLYNGQNVTMNFDIAFNLMAAAFEGGTGDYCTMFEPTASEYQAAGKGYIVASVGQESGEIPYTCFMAKGSWLQKNQETASGVLRAVTKAIKYLNENPENAVAEKLTAYFDGTGVSSIETSLRSYKAIDAWRTEMTMTESSFDRLCAVIENAGELPKGVEFSKLVDNTLAAAAYKAIYA